jgi:hypothetical protein
LFSGGGPVAIRPGAGGLVDRAVDRLPLETLPHVIALTKSHDPAVKKVFVQPNA